MQYDDIQEIIREADSDGNGAIDYEEFETLMKNVLKQV